MFRFLLLLCLMVQQTSGTNIHHEAKTSGKSEPMPDRANDYDPIAFSVELSSGQYYGEEPISFDRVLTDVGERYSPDNGQFICPDEGPYVFVWSLWKGGISTYPGMRAIASLRHAFTDFKYGPRTSYYDTGRSGVVEMTAVMECASPPIAVTILSVPWSGFAPTYYVETGTSFSGFRLQAPIAFTAELSTDQVVNPGSTIGFDDVLSNFGGFYDATEHSFKCPDDGVYVFSVSTHTKDPTTPWSVARLMLEGVTIMEGPITFIATESYDSGSASTTAVLNCREGSDVYVEAQAAHDFDVNSYGAKLTSFTGFKLYDVVPDAVAFTAVMTTNHTTTSAGQPLMFDQVITNVGDAFDVEASAFVCPDNDFYLFTWTTAADYGGSSSETDLYMDDTRIKYLRLIEQSSDAASGTSGSSSLSIIQQCVTGSTLQVVGRTAQGRVYLGGYNSFSGYKIPG